MPSLATPAVWSRAAASDLARDLLTPFTWSILSRSAERAVRSHYSAGWGLPLVETDVAVRSTIAYARPKGSL